MPRYVAFLLMIGVAAGALLAGCAAPSADAPVRAAAGVDSEGLAIVKSRTFDTAQVRPDAKFSTYSSITLQTPDLSYRSPAQAEGEFVLTDAQKDRFRDGLVDAFAREFAGLNGLVLVDSAGPNTLALHVRVQDIVAKVAPRAVGRGGRSAALLEASGNAAIVVELRDSLTGTILARGVDAATARGAAMRSSGDEMKTRFEAADKIVNEWASSARKGVESLVAHGD